jgi:hypothetical protein
VETDKGVFLLLFPMEELVDLLEKKGRRFHIAFLLFEKLKCSRGVGLVSVAKVRYNCSG